jgi:hypothetical protein
MPVLTGFFLLFLLGADCTVTGSYVVTQADIDTAGNMGGDGYIHNTAYGWSDETGRLSDDAQAPLAPQNPLMSVVKTVTNTGSYLGGLFDAGDTITYGITVTNDGNVTLNNVVVNDAVAGLTDAPCALALLPGDSCAVDTGAYEVTMFDLISQGDGDGDIDNTAIASSDEAPDAEDSSEALLAPPPIELEVPVNNTLALLLMVLAMLATAWYFRPAVTRKH